MQDEEVKYLEATIEKASDGSFTAIASTNAVDRHGEVVDNNGWDLKAFKKNPVILWAHDHSEPAIGVSKKTWVEGTGKKAQLMIQPLIHDVTEKARAVKQLIDMGVIKTLSVGFKPLESPDGITFTKNELLEVSMVNVPANAEAMALAYKGLKSKGFDDEVIEELGIKQMDENQMMKSLKGMQQTMKAMQSHMDDMMGNMGMKSIENDNQVVDSPVKEASVSVESRRETNERLSMLKVIARASDKLLEGEKKNLPKADRINLTKVIKRANELITIEDLKKVR